MKPHKGVHLVVFDECLIHANRAFVHSKVMKRRGLMLIGVICLLAAAYLWASFDPWARASAQGSADARAVHEVRNQPERLGFLLSTDPALLKAVVWSDTGSVLYPGPGTYAPMRFELSVEELDDLTRLTSADFTAKWSTYDRDRQQLLYCQPTPRICLLYDRNELQVAPTTSLAPPPAWILAGIAALCMILWWRLGPATLSDDQLVLLPEQHAAQRGTLEVALTPRDFRLLEFLQNRKGKVVTKDELYDAGWGRDFMPNSRALDQHMINLRKKLDPDKSRSPVIETVRGVGYRLL